MDEKPPIEPVLRALAAKARRNLDDHPTPEELVAYRAGELTEQDEEKIQDHLALCVDCSQLLLDLKEFEDGQPEKDPGLSDAQVEAAWRRLRPRLEERKVLTSPRWFASPRIAYGLAAALFVCVIGLGGWGVSLQSRLEELSKPKVDVTALDLLPKSGTRGEESANVISTRNFLLVVHLSFDVPKQSEYEVEIATAPEGGKSKWRDRVPAKGDLLEIYLPEGVLPPGKYWVRLYGTEGERRALPESYPSFEISYAQ